MAQPLTDGPIHRPARVALVRLAVRLVTGALFRLRVEGLANLPEGAAIYCCNHLNWADPLFVLAALPSTPKVAMFGPKEADMGVGVRNRLITWAGFGVPYRPEKTDLLETARRVRRVLADGWALFIFGEGRIHRGERELLPLADGTAFFALRSGVPIVPMAINGTSWLGFGRTVRVRIGIPIPAPAGRATRESIAALTAETEMALLALVADARDRPPPGRFGRWLTELFNEWPEGSRPEPGERDGSA